VKPRERRIILLAASVRAGWLGGVGGIGGISFPMGEDSEFLVVHQVSLSDSM